MCKIAVVILNYLNYKDTLECVESINKQFYKDIEIIIVDNGSKNDSFEQINNKFNNCKKVHIIKSDKNLGFAKGNNLGIDYARLKLNCNFILLVNNDTVFTDRNLVKILIDEYEENVAIIGPRIVSADGQEQNPSTIGVDKKQLDKECRILNSKKYKIKSSKVYNYLKRVFMPSKETIMCSDNNFLKSQDLVLHGACMLLTKDYFEFYPKLFPETFLYYEENILTLLTKKVNLEKKFINNTWIFHKEDQSSKMSFNNKNSIKIKYQLDSMKICKQLFDKSYKQIYELYFTEHN